MDALLVLNAGSASLKYAVYEPGGPDAVEPRFAGEVEIGAPARGAAADHGEALARALAAVDERLGGTPLAGVGHRVVHGGVRFAAPVRVDDEVLRALERLVPLAPLHQPPALDAIRAVAAARPGLAQVACFDTAFHRTQPEVAQRFALPRSLTESGVRRYGFHGLAFESVMAGLARVAPEAARGRVVAAHLGSGASLCAIEAGRSVATTMGMTPLDGLPMGTRCGDVDPGVLLHLLNAHGMAPAALERLLYRGSGLLGVSGVASDMRALLASESPHAREAVDLFVYRIGRELGSMAAALGGVDALVFSGGIGEHAAGIRARVCRDAAWLGVELDVRANEAGGPRVHGPGSRAGAWVIPSDENRVIARHVARLLAAA